MIDIEIALPVFPGFYGTIFENIIQEKEDWIINDYQDYYDKFVDSDKFVFDYKSMQNDISKKCCSIIENKLKEIDDECTITFKYLESPKFYNFSNDIIVCDILIDINKIKEILLNNQELFKIYLEKNYTSYDGFISFHSTESNDWMENLEKDEHKLSSSLNFILEELLEYDYDSLYYDVSEEDFQLNYKVKR